MKLSVIIKKLQAELEQLGDKEISDVELPPLPKGQAEKAWCIDLRYS